MNVPARVQYTYYCSGPILDKPDDNAALARLLCLLFLPKERGVRLAGVCASPRVVGLPSSVCNAEGEGGT